MKTEWQNHVELPASTAWPVALALGVMLVFTGLITSAAVSIAGAVVLVGSLVGWARQIFPDERHVRVPVAQPEERSWPAPVAVERVRAGAPEHRMRAPVRIRPFTAAFRGGVVGGIGMAGVAMAFGYLSQGSIWYPINLLAAAVAPDLASASLAQLREFSVEGLVLGTIIHGTTSFLVGMLYAVMLPMFPRGAFWWAGLTAPVLWSGLIAILLQLVNPTLNERVDWRWFVASQVVWGLTGGFVIARTQYIERREHLPLVVRAGIEAPGAMPRDESDQDKQD